MRTAVKSKAFHSLSKLLNKIAAATRNIRQQWKGLGENSLRAASEKQQGTAFKNTYNSLNIGVSEFYFLTDCNSRDKQERNTKLELRSEMEPHYQKSIMHNSGNVHLPH